MDYLLDTNILLVYVRGNDVTKEIESELQLLSGNHNLMTSVVSVGEIQSLAIRNKWGPRKVKNLQHLLNQFLIADINVEDIIKKYAEIDAYSQGKLPEKVSSFSARNMSKNDLWIAATGTVLNLVLVTTDHDFDHLHDTYLKVKKVDLAKYLKK